MTGVNNSDERRSIINDVKALLKGRVPDGQMEVLNAFTERYFHSTQIDDLRDHSIEDLASIVLSHWKFIYQRQPDESKVNVFNPGKAKDGWESTHTLIQISHNDIPFLVDSIRMVINRYGYQIHFIIHFGGLKLMRDEAHRIVSVLPVGEIDKDATTEAPIYIEIDRLPDEKHMTALKDEIERSLADVALSVVDWRKMMTRVQECLRELETNPPTTLDEAELAESRDFLRWLINNNFTFLGARDYKLIGNGTNRALQVVPGSGLGVLREKSASKTSKNYS